MNGTMNVDPDPTFTWRWVDDLIANGSFESGMSPGWYTGGPDSSIWQVYTSTTNAYGMGYKWATTFMPSSNRATGQMIQDLYVPADATSATLQWKERIWQLASPGMLIGRLRILLYQNGSPVLLLEDAFGTEYEFGTHNWVSRSTNLLAYAGQSLQLVIQADSYSSLARSFWIADVDGFTFSSEHFSAPPEFQVYLGRSSPLRSTNQVGDLTALNFAAPPLSPSTVYYWRVAAVRDGVTNYSSTALFKTGQRVLPMLALSGRSDTGLRFTFPSRSSRAYTIEQKDGLDDDFNWYDVLPIGYGTDSPMEVEVPYPWSGIGFWRLRVSP